MDGRSPEERFRTVYCATQRAAAFGETVARFRPSIVLLAHLAEVEDDESVEQALAGAVDPEDPYRGLIPADWRLLRRIGHTILMQTFASWISLQLQACSICGRHSPLGRPNSGFLMLTSVR